MVAANITEESPFPIERIKTVVAAGEADDEGKNRPFQLKGLRLSRRTLSSHKDEESPFPIERIKTPGQRG